LNEGSWKLLSMVLRSHTCLTFSSFLLHTPISLNGFSGKYFFTKFLVHESSSRCLLLGNPPKQLLLMLQCMSFHSFSYTYTPRVWFGHGVFYGRSDSYLPAKTVMFGHMIHVSTDIHISWLRRSRRWGQEVKTVWLKEWALWFSDIIRGLNSVFNQGFHK
jgi:hypothetical protein